MGLEWSGISRLAINGPGPKEEALRWSPAKQQRKRGREEGMKREERCDEFVIKDMYFLCARN